VVSRTSLVIARLLWAAPTLLFLLGINQLYVARDLRTTLDEGVAATADVIKYTRVDRQDITFAEVNLIVHMPDGTTFERDRMSLPYSLSFRIKDEKKLGVRVKAGSAQEVVITEIAATQSRIAWMNAVISLLGSILLAIAVYSWNRFLKRKGDPALAQPSERPTNV